MILIADRGSTKTDWWLSAADGSTKGTLMTTQGMNPFHQDEQQLSAVLTTELLPQLASRRPEHIYFYGSGCTKEMAPTMRRVLKAAMPDAQTIDANSDMLGAARAVCGRSEGIVCILGTGANSCLYNGHDIVANTPPLGYILGDEGSGAVIGKNFINAMYRGMLPKAVVEDFEREQQLTMAQVMDHVYRQPLPNRFLASMSPFIHQHLNVKEVRSLVTECLQKFIRTNLRQYGKPHLPIGAVGSIAYHYRQLLHEAALGEGFTTGRILKSPVKGLIEYHC